METIDPRHLLIKVAGILEKLDIPYAITGGMAVFVWGKPRFTADIDIVILFEARHISQLAEALHAISEASYVDTEAMRRALEKHGEFNFIDGATGMKVDFWALDGKAFDSSQISRRREREVLGNSVYFVSPEDLILSKLRWHKEGGSIRQLEDIESVLKIQKELDFDYIQQWAKDQSTYQIFEELWEKIKK